MEAKIENRPRTDSEPESAPRRKGPVYLAIWRELADRALKNGAPVPVLAMTKEKEDAMLATAKFASIGIQCGEFKLDGDSGMWMSRAFGIPAAEYGDFLQTHCDYVDAESPDPGDGGEVEKFVREAGFGAPEIDRYRMVGF